MSGIPCLKAFKNGPSTIFIPDRYDLSPTNFCIKSLIFTSALKLYLIYFISSPFSNMISPWLQDFSLFLS